MTHPDGMRRSLRHLAAAARLLGCLLLSSCGTHVPRLEEVWEPADVGGDLVYRIKKSVYCELRTAIRELGPAPAVIRGKKVQAIPDDWGVQLTLTLTVDEMGALAPSAQYNRNIVPARDPRALGGLVPQTFTLPAAIQLSSQATRIDTYYSFFLAKGLKRDYPHDTSCEELDPTTLERRPLDRRGTSYLLSGDLGIKDWLAGALLANDALPSSDFPNGASKKLDVLQYNVKFVVVTAGTVNPMWKLAPLATGVGSMPLASANRTRTHQMLVTLGPADVTRGSEGPGAQANSLNVTGQLEQAVSTGFRSALGQ